MGTSPVYPGVSAEGSLLKDSLSNGQSISHVVAFMNTWSSTRGRGRPRIAQWQQPMGGGMCRFERSKKDSSKGFAFPSLCGLERDDGVDDDDDGDEEEEEADVDVDVDVDVSDIPSPASDPVHAAVLVSDASDDVDDAVLDCS